MVHMGLEPRDANSRNLSYSQVACVTILTWDVLIMLSEEVSPVSIKHYLLLIAHQVEFIWQ